MTVGKVAEQTKALLLFGTVGVNGVGRPLSPLLSVTAINQISLKHLKG